MKRSGWKPVLLPHHPPLSGRTGPHYQEFHSPLLSFPPTQGVDLGTHIGPSYSMPAFSFTALNSPCAKYSRECSTILSALH